MSDLYKNPETEPQDEMLVSRNEDMVDWGGSHMEPAGPAGTSTITNANEKGILETALFRVMAMHQKAELGSNHDAHAQGIYADTEGKYRD
jgi:hypothetical protein